MRNPLPALLLLLLPICTHAQDPLFSRMDDHVYFGAPNYNSPQDSADFALFRKSLVQPGSNLEPDTTMVSYHLVWREIQRGGLWTVSRGDGSLRKASPTEAIFASDQISIAFRTADGRSGLFLMFEEPCGLICRSALYYVEE